MKFKKFLYVILGCFGVAMGALGVVLPLLPAFPFLLYKNNLESYVNGRGMTRKTKVKIMVMVTALMSIGFIMMDQVPIGRFVLAGVWMFHILYFIFGVKTKGKQC